MYQRTTLSTASNAVALSASVSDSVSSVSNVVSTAVSNAVSGELNESLQRTLTNERLVALGRNLSLPANARSFWLFLAGVLLVCAGMLMHILLSVQLWQGQLHLQELQAQYQSIEQQNAEEVWQIATASSLESIRLRAIAQGYEVPLERHYIAMPSVTKPGVAMQDVALSTELSVTPLSVAARAQNAGVDAKTEVTLALNEPTGNGKKSSNAVSRLWQQMKSWLGGQ
jgi:hypothetical protein